MALTRAGRRRLLQRVFWNAPGFALLRGYRWATRRIDYVLLNRSLDSETNGEGWLLTTLPEKPLVIDVGFNTGDYTRAVLAERPGATVIAYDPARFAQRRHADAFSADQRVTFVSAAVSSAPGAAHFYDYGNMCSSLADREGQGDLKERYTVPVVTLDEDLPARGIAHVDLLKIDAEGYDANVLEGARMLLRRRAIDLFMFEFADGWAANRRYFHDVQTLVADLPYDLYRLFNGFLVPIGREPILPSYELGFMAVGVSRTARNGDSIRVRTGAP